MYEVNFSEEAERYFNKLDKSVQERIGKKINELSKNPRLGKPMSANLSGLWSLRIGDYRTIYAIKDRELLVIVIRIGHRKNVYGN